MGVEHLLRTMLTVKASVKPSKIQGLGLFADEKIPKGTVVWKFDSRFDIYFDLEEVDKMSEQQKYFLNRYAPISTNTGKYILSVDDSRFTNHSSLHSNTDTIDSPGEPEKIAIANKDIEKGEEILMNYHDFDENSQNSGEEYLKS